MSNQFGKQIINTNKALFVTFPVNSTTTSCDIYIPFPVSEIHVRGIDIDWQADYLTVVFTSSLFNDGPVGSAFCGVGSDLSNATKKIRYIYAQPRDINGSYQFSYKAVDTTILIADAHYGTACFIIEFIGYL